MKKVNLTNLSFKKKLLIAGICFLLIVFAALVIARKAMNKSSLDTTVYQVKTETYENCIEIAGTASAAEEQTLQALSNGTVTDVFVKAGDHVKKGDILIQLDDTTELYNLEKHDYDMQITKANGSAKEYKLMQTQRLALVQKVADRKIIATFDGVIADLDVNVNDSLEAKDKVGTIVNIDYLTADVEIAETDVAKLKAGQKVSFTFPAYKDAAVYGYVVSWPAIGEITSRGATIVKAKVRIDEYPAEILPNFSFTGKIEIEAPVENIIVERYAVAFDNGKAYVELAKNGQKIDVEARPYGKTYMKITSGLKGGEILKAQSAPKASGWNKNNNRGGMGSMGGMPPMGAGAPPARR